MKLFGKNVEKNSVLYWGFIITFIILYAATAFVSWYHSISFFNIANAAWLSVILSFVAEVGQAGILFSILLTKNTKKFLSWATMVILTSLQIIGNVVASYKFIVTANSNDFTYFKDSILFWVQAANPQMFKVIVAWIAGALLPIIALSMTALVAQNIKLKEEEDAEKAKEKKGSVPDEEVQEIIENEVERKVQAFKPETSEQPSLKDAILTPDVSLNFDGLKNEFDRLTNVNKFADGSIETSFKVEAPEISIDLQPRPEITPYSSWGVSEKDDLDKDVEMYMPETTVPKVEVEKINELPINLEKGEPDEGLKKAAEEATHEISLKKQQEEEYATTEPPKRKRGRPPKQQNETVAEPKKEQELQQEEDVEVPEKPKRFVDPLKLKDKKIKPIKKLDEIIKPSKGDEVIELIEKQEKEKEKVPITQPTESEEKSQESLLVPPELLTPYIQQTGVEVIDAKAITKEPEQQKEPGKVDKFGIPILPGEHRNFDRI
jgi:hypothetical protein